MYYFRFFFSVALVGLFCAAAQAEIVLDGFQGTFGSIETDFQKVIFTDGETSGGTAMSGILASLGDLSVNLAGFTGSGDPVSISNLILTGNGIDCIGDATYCWEDANLYQLLYSPPGVGYITGTLDLQSGGTFQVSSGTISLPESIEVALTYNGLIVTSNGFNGSGTIHSPSASVSALAIDAPVPEPSTIVCLLAGLGTLLIWRRRK